MGMMRFSKISEGLGSPSQGVALVEEAAIAKRIAIPKRAFMVVTPSLLHKSYAPPIQKPGEKTTETRCGNGKKISTVLDAIPYATKGYWWARPDSNREPRDYELAAVRPHLAPSLWQAMTFPFVTSQQRRVSSPVSSKLTQSGVLTVGITGTKPDKPL